jgi:hypothetical protein
MITIIEAEICDEKGNLQLIIVEQGHEKNSCSD